jgi:hypothetical protein
MECGARYFDFREFSRATLWAPWSGIAAQTFDPSLPGRFPQVGQGLRFAQEMLWSPAR